jgi:hypothetical protein
MLSLSRIYFFLKELLLTIELTESELAQFSDHIHQICDSVQERNLTLVSNAIESTSGHNNHKLVVSAVHFVKECVRGFNRNYANDYAKSDYFNEFIVYTREVERDFEKKNYDPDGVGGGTITDILNKIKRSH